MPKTNKNTIKYTKNPTKPNAPLGQCSRYQLFTNGTSNARRVRPDRRLNGCGAHNNAIPFAVLSVYNAVLSNNGAT